MPISRIKNEDNQASVTHTSEAEMGRIMVQGQPETPSKPTAGCNGTHAPYHHKLGVVG
jgi:hypothetical protein